MGQHGSCPQKPCLLEPNLVQPIPAVDHGEVIHSGRRREGSKYVGSYSLLVGFLKRCQETGCAPLAKDQFQELMNAVDTLHVEKTRSISLEQEHFRGHEKYLTVLDAWGMVSYLRGLSLRLQEEDDAGETQREATNSRAAAMLHTLDFDFKSWGDLKADVPILVYGIRAPFELISRYHMDSDVLGSWIEAIGGLYLQKPYHNWRHAVDVFQLSYMSLTTGDAGAYFGYLDILALLLAAIGHDVGHTGTNNAFHVKTNSDLALLYNDQSPLENMHAHVFFETLRRPGLDVTGGMEEKTFRSLRSLIIDAILATDMGHHFDLVDRFSARVSQEVALNRADVRMDRCLSTPAVTPRTSAAANPPTSREQVENKNDRRLLVQVFTHMADLGHTCRPWDVHKHLVAALEEEFFNQGDQERELGIPIMPLMDRKTDSTAASQGFFLEKVVNPLLEPFSRLLSPAMGPLLRENIARNRENWTALVEKHGKKTAREIVRLEECGENGDKMGTV